LEPPRSVIPFPPKNSLAEEAGALRQLRDHMETLQNVYRTRSLSLLTKAFESAGLAGKLEVVEVIESDQNTMIVTIRACE